MFHEMTECHILFRFTVTLTSDLLGRNSKFGVYMHLGMGSVSYHFQVTVTLTSDLVLVIIVSGAYLLYYLR